MNEPPEAVLRSRPMQDTTGAAWSWVPVGLTTGLWLVNFTDRS